MRLADLKLNPDNPRNIKPEKLDKLAQSIKDFPKMMVKRPIVYDENKVIIGGNMRYKAIEKLGMTEIPDEWTSDASDFTPEERKRFIMQDNAEMGEHDWDMVAQQYELEDLDAWGIDVPYADSDQQVEEDEAPEVSSEPPVSQLGKIYQLGRHRVMCGDSTDKEQIGLLMNNEVADILFTSPPYNAGDNSLGGNKNKVDNKYEQYDDNKTQDEWRSLLNTTLVIAREFSKYQFYNVQMLAGNKKAFWEMVTDNVDYLADVSIWDKGGGQPAMARNVMNSRFEFILIFSSEENPKRSIKTANFKGTVSNIVSITRDESNENSKIHAATFPVTFVAHFISNFTKKGNIVLDNFIGVGSTLIACEQTDRICYGMELDEKYLDVIRKRWAKYVYPDRWEKEWEILTPAIEKL